MPFKDEEKRKQYQKEYQSKWYEKNKDRHRANCKAWKAENPDKVRQHRTDRYRRESAAQGGVVTYFLL